VTTTSPISLDGRRAVVTGASRGIGFAIARAFVRAGADVAVIARDPNALETAAADLRASGRRVVAEPCDVTDAADVERAAAAIAQAFGGIDILVNNAGSSGTHKLLGHPDELWHRMLAENLTSVYFVTKAFLPLLVGRGSRRIVNIASTAAKTGARYTAAYTAAKHGVLGLTRVLALELAGDGITVNAICPGFTDTPMTERSVANIVAQTGRSEAEARAILAEMNAGRRLIAPEEVADVALALASDASGGINGQAIDVTGVETADELRLRVLQRVSADARGASRRAAKSSVTE